MSVALVRCNQAIEPPQQTTALSPSQYRFLTLDSKYRAFVGGYGSGKTFVACLSLISFAMRHPGVVQGYFAPTYPLIRDIFYPAIAEAAELLNVDARIYQSNKEVNLSRGGRQYGTIICRTMDPATIIGFKISHAVCDELDVLPTEKAEAVWNKIIARMRLVIPGIINGIDITTTPEGFRWCYKNFARDPKSNYKMVTSHTRENARNLPSDYISSLEETYTPRLVDAYLGGKFVNMTSGAVYHAFDRVLNNSSRTIQPEETLHIGIDFNVGKMSAAVHVIDDKLPTAVDELTGLLDTPAMIRAIKNTFAGHPIVVYPDSSGGSRKSVDASKTDIKLLRDAGLRVRAPKANPPVRARITSVNSIILNAKNERRYKINTAKCPVLTECLEQQAYNAAGEPDKTAGLDHLPDACGYFIHNTFPAGRKRQAINLPIRMI